MARVIDGKVMLGPDDGAVIDALRAAMASNAARRLSKQNKSPQPDLASDYGRARMKG